MEVLAVNLGELAALVDGQLVGSAGCEQLEVHDALPLQDACQGCITLMDSIKHLEKLTNSPATAVVVPEAWEQCQKPMLVVERLHHAFQLIIHRLRPPHRARQSPGVSPFAFVDAGAKLGRDCEIGPQATVAEACVLGDRCRIHPGVHIMAGCRLGDDCEIMPGVVLYPGTVIGKRATIHANSVLGAYGFGYRLVDGRHERTSQLGWVEVGDDVEIGAGSTVDRGTYGPTRIGVGSKLDNLVHIGHNCHLGQHNLICGHVGMAGSCTTGDYVVMAGQVGVADHLHIGDRSRIGAQSGIMQDIAAGQAVIGTPATPAKQKMQEYAVSARLPEMRRELRELSKQVLRLEQHLNSTPIEERRDAA